MLRSAIFGAIAKEDARGVRLHPHRVGAIGNDVHLARQLRHPEAVNHIRRFERERRGSALVAGADRNVQFVRSNHAEIWIMNLPPPLMSDHADFERVGGQLRILHVGDRARRDQHQDEDDKNRDDRPRQLELVAAINLRRLFSIVARLRAELDDDVGEQSGNDDKDGRADDQRQQ
jgi:hypothetical protein